MRLASLPMYDFPEVRGANDALWEWIAARLREQGVAGVPERLTRPDDLHGLWRSPDLLLAQTCGYPLTTLLAGAVRVVATPVYRAPGCRGTRHRSFVVVPGGHPARRLADLRGAVCAVNDRHSNTGMNLLRALVAPLAEGGRFFGRVAVTGSHARSLELVAAGEAEVAAIDCITHAHLARHRPALVAGTRVLARTAPTPGLPLVTASATAPDALAALRRALREAEAAPELADVRDRLFLARFAVLPERAYGVVLGLERHAAALGYPELA